jgi:hypothetical protein
MAPGVKIYSTTNTGGYELKSGTSMASPHVAGVVALMRAADSSLSPNAIRTLLQETGECPNGEQSGAATCVGKGAWLMSQPLGGTGPDPDGISEPLVHALRAADAAAGDVTTFPDVAIAAPMSDDLLSGSVDVDVDATDETGVAQVELFVDGSSAGIDATAPYSFTWDSTTAGDGVHTLTAEATSTSGGATTSAPVSVRIDNTAPTVAVTAPSDGATVSGVVDITASAADESGIDQVEFFVDGESLATVPGQGAADGYLDVGLARLGQPQRSGADKDVPHPTTSHELRLDVEMVSLTDGNIAAINNGSNKREWGFMTSGGGTSVAYAASKSGRSWSQRLETPAVLTAGTRVQLRVVHSGSAVAIYTRDPAVLNLPLDSDAGWTLAAEDTTFAQSVAEIVDRSNAPLDLFTRVSNATSDMPYKLYEFEYRVDGLLAAHIVGGDAVLDTGNDEMYDEMGNRWSWVGDADPTVVANTATGYATSWDATTAAPGVHTIAATATDAAGLSSTHAVTVVVEGVPSVPAVDITAPADGASVSGVLNVTADAADETGVTHVEFLIDGASIGVDTTDPYEASWDTTAGSDGVRSVEAVVTNSEGATANDTISVTVVNTAPTVAITAPSGGAYATGSVQVTADASAPTGVTQVEFFVDGASIGVDTDEPYAVTWDSTGNTDGPVSLEAVASDANGTDVTSDPIGVTVDNTAPAVSISAPADGADVSGTVDISADASDASGLTQVEFFVDGISIGVDTDAPYGAAWDSTVGPNGTYSFTAEATDPVGLVTTSAAVSVSVDNGPGGTVFVTDVATSESTRIGKRQSGSYLETAADDGSLEEISESRFRPFGSRRATSRLEHTWSITVTGGLAVTLEMNAWSDVSTDGDSFVIAYSDDGGTSYTDVFTLSTIDSGVQTFALPADLVGDVLIRVVDTDATVRNTAKDWIYVDYLAVVSQTS